MAFKKSLYQILEIRSDATAEALKEAYEARLARLADAVSAEDLSTRSMLRDAFEILGDPLRRKQYDERLREELIRALSSGMDEERPRPANARSNSDVQPFDPVPVRHNWHVMYGTAALIIACVTGAWVYFDHTRQVAAQRIAAEKFAAEERRLEQEARRRDEMANWSKDRAEANRQASEYRQRQAEIDRSSQQYSSEKQRQAYQAAAEEQKKQAQRRNAELQLQREEQENLRRSQAQLERERRYLKELESNRGMKF